MNVFLNLPMPVGVGVGASVDTTTLGANKTITVEGGSFENSVISIEASVDGGTVWSTITSFQGGGGLVTSQVVASLMRVRVSGVTVSGITAGVAAPSSACLFANLNVPPDNGSGTSTDISLFGRVVSVQVGGTFSGPVVAVDVSNDGMAWVQACNFAQPGLQTILLTAKFARVSVSGKLIGMPYSGVTASLGASDAVDSGGISVDTPTELIFRPNDPAGPRLNIYTDWVACYTQIDSLRSLAVGNINVVWDTQYCDPLPSYGNNPVFIMPAKSGGGDWDFTNVTFSNPFTTAFVYLSFADDCTIINLRAVQGYRFVFIGTSTVTSAIKLMANTELGQIGARTQFVSVPGAKPVVIVMEDGALIWASGNQIYGFFGESVALGGVVDTAPCIDLNGHLLVLESPNAVGDWLTDNSVGANGVVILVNNTSLMLNYSNFSMPSLPVTVTWLVFGQQTLNYSYWNGDGTPLTTTPYDVSAQQLFPYTTVIPCSTVAGAFSVILPTAKRSTGFTIIIYDATDNAGAHNVTITPQVGETINGNPNYVISSNNGSVQLLSNGLGDWRVIAVA